MVFAGGWWRESLFYSGFCSSRLLDHFWSLWSFRHIYLAFLSISFIIIWYCLLVSFCGCRFYLLWLFNVFLRVLIMAVSLCFQLISWKYPALLGFIPPWFKMSDLYDLYVLLIFFLCRGNNTIWTTSRRL